MERVIQSRFQAMRYHGPRCMRPRPATAISMTSCCRRQAGDAMCACSPLSAARRTAIRSGNSKYMVRFRSVPLHGQWARDQEMLFPHDSLVDRSFPLWSPSGKSIAFLEWSGGNGFGKIIHLTGGRRIQDGAAARGKRLCDASNIAQAVINNGNHPHSHSMVLGGLELTS